MRTLTEKYNGVLKGTYTKDHFIREARMQFPNLITQHNSYQDATRILLNKGIITENEAEKVVVKEAYGMSLEDAKAEALKTSKEEGVVQHVEETEEGSGKYRVSDFYDSDLTVVSYENGRPLNEAEKVSNPKKADLNKDGKLSDYEKKRGAAIEKAMSVKEEGLNKELEKEAINISEGAQEVKGDPDDISDGRKSNELQNGAIGEASQDVDPKIEKLVAGINDLIARAVDSDGDPIGVVYPTSTWEEPYVYEPIQYKNGRLKIISKSPYQKTSDVDIILPRNMEFDGIPTLRLIMRMYKKAVKQASMNSSTDSDMVEKQITYAQKAGKEGDISESSQDIDQAYYDVLAVIRKHARKLNDDDAYQFHEQLKSFFNRLLESSPEEKPVQVGDVIDHKGVQKTIVRIDGHKVYLQPVSATKGGGIEIDRKLGITRDMAMRGKTLGESKETGYQVPKPELPIDVVHHGIRFELDKKGIGNTPNEEEYLKAYKLASKNISKDLLFYKKEEGAVQLPDNATDQMTKVKLKEGIKGIIKKILSEEVSSTKKPFNAKGELL